MMSGDELGELRGSIREVLTDHPGPAQSIPDEAGFGFDRALWKKLGELGWLGLGFDERYGGAGCGAVELGVLYEECGRVLAAAPIVECALAAQAIAAHGSSDLQARLLPSIGRGFVATLALGARIGVEDGRATGTLADVPFAAEAGAVLVRVRCDGHSALALVLTEALDVEEVDLVDLTRRIGRLSLDRAPIEELLVLNDADMDSLRDHYALALACDSIGGASAIFERTIGYLNLRQQFGRPIGAFQALKHRMADWKVQLEAASTLVRSGMAALAIRDPQTSALASAAKAYACDVYAAFCGDAVQLHGGIGFTWEHPCHLYLKRAKYNQQFGGTAAHHKDRVAEFEFACYLQET